VNHARPLLVLATLLLASATTWADDDASVTVIGGGVVPAPAEGYVWKKVREAEDPKNGKIEFYTATKEGADGKVVMIVEQATADTDDLRLVRIKADYNSLATSLKEAGYTELKGAKPTLTTPIADRVAFIIGGKDPEGKAMVFLSVLFFGKSTYHFQAAAGTEEEAKALATVSGQVKEK
jgi:hypothetical protein